MQTFYGQATHSDDSPYGTNRQAPLFGSKLEENCEMRDTSNVQDNTQEYIYFMLS